MSADRFDSTAFTVRVARPDDVPDLFAMVRELAQFEQLEHLLDASEADMHAELFGRDGGAEALVAEGGSGRGRGTVDRLRDLLRKLLVVSVPPRAVPGRHLRPAGVSPPGCRQSIFTAVGTYGKSISDGGGFS